MGLAAMRQFRLVDIAGGKFIQTLQERFQRECQLAVEHGQSIELDAKIKIIPDKDEPSNFKILTKIKLKEPDSIGLDQATLVDDELMCQNPLGVEAIQLLMSFNEAKTELKIHES